LLEPGTQIDAFSGNPIGLPDREVDGVSAPGLFEPADTDAPGGGEGGEGGGGAGGDLPDLPTLPEPPDIPAPDEPPEFPNPNKLIGGGPAMDETRRIIEDARRFGRQSTILTGGGEGLTDVGEVDVPALTGESPQGTPVTPGKAPAATREGTRPSGNRFAGTVTKEFDLIESQNLKNGSTETAPPSSLALPDGWSLIKSYTTIPYDVVRDPSGKHYIRDTRTGEMTGDLLLSLPAPVTGALRPRRSP
jgi:hypothetical protein